MGATGGTDKSAEDEIRQALESVNELAEIRTESARLQLAAYLDYPNLAVTIDAARALIQIWGADGVMAVLIAASSEDAKNNNQVSWTLWGVLRELEILNGVPVSDWLVELEGRPTAQPSLRRAIDSIRSVGWPVVQGPGNQVSDS